MILDQNDFFVRKEPGNQATIQKLDMPGYPVVSLFFERVKGFYFHIVCTWLYIGNNIET